jgi:hypothetical protein
MNGHTNFMQKSTKNKNEMDCPIKVKLMFTPITPVLESFWLLEETGNQV